MDGAPDHRQARFPEPLLFELDHRGAGFEPDDHVPEPLRRTEPVGLPNLGELQVLRHFTRLSQMNFGIETGMYPLGSCTMKYNPKVLEDAAALAGVRDLHPEQDPATVQGALEVMHGLGRQLATIAGMDAVTLQPAAGAHGEWTGLLIARAFHRANGEADQRTEVVVPDSAHGTNPASAAMAGYDVVEVPSGDDGRVDLTALKAAVTERTACLMLTNPNTLGLFESGVRDLARTVHDAGGLLYYDGANLNAIMGRTDPGRMGFDVVHFNLHKTFATPHGGGGPGAGPVGVVERLTRFLPVPVVVELDDGTYGLDRDRPDSIGKVGPFAGHFATLFRAYGYILAHGGDGLSALTDTAVLNANYLLHRLQADPVGRDAYGAPYPGPRKHEVVVSCQPLKEATGVRALDVAKRLLDFGFHAPTIYFPDIVPEALMIEPTESESVETLDAFADALVEIAREARDDPERVKGAPYTTAVGRVDEVYAARNPCFCWEA